MLVRDPVCDAVAVAVPEEDTETEALSDHSGLVEECAEPVYETEGLEDSESKAERVISLLTEPVRLLSPVVLGHTVCVAVPVRLRLCVGVAESVRLCVQVR